MATLTPPAALFRGRSELAEIVSLPGSFASFELHPRFVIGRTA